MPYLLLGALVFANTLHSAVVKDKDGLISQCVLFFLWLILLNSTRKIPFLSA